MSFHCRRPSLVTRPSRSSSSYQTGKAPTWVLHSLSFYSSAVASCWLVCSTATSFHSTSAAASERKSGLSFSILLRCVHMWVGEPLIYWDTILFCPGRYFVKLPVAEAKLPPHYPISQPTLRLIEQILMLYRWSKTQQHVPSLSGFVCFELCHIRIQLLSRKQLINLNKQKPSAAVKNALIETKIRSKTFNQSFFFAVAVLLDMNEVSTKYTYIYCLYIIILKNAQEK